MQDDAATKSLEDENRHLGVVIEDINDKLGRLLEATSTLKDVPQKLDQLAGDVSDLKGDMRVVKAVVTDTSNQVHRHERDIKKFKLKIA